ncbi:MAG: alpha/beta hydrolase [Cyanobacteria bacterium J06623_7]
MFSALLPSVALSAERITFSLKPFGQFQIQIEDLEAFVTTGTKTTELDYYLRRLTPEQQGSLPGLLSTPLQFEPLTVAKFSNSTVGEVAIATLGKGIRASSTRNGFYALRGAIIAAAFDEEGLSLINLLQHYPLETVHLDLEVLTQYLQRGMAIAHNRQEIDRTWFDLSATIAHNPSGQQPSPQIKTDRALPTLVEKLQSLGQYTWRQRTLSYQNGPGSETRLFDLYQPEITGSVPLIVISHGIASNRQTFAYLGKHLASYGFAVAAIEHNEISLDQFDRILAGTESFPQVENLLGRPRDISSVLDRLEAEPEIDVEQVGVIGQSFGGYNALALSGGKLTPGVNSAVCQRENYRYVLLDLSSLAQCSFLQRHLSQVELRDERVKATVAINPMAKIFGQGIGSVQTPTMIIAGTNDLIMPPVTEQIRPFAGLNQDLDNYLVMVKPGTHFSFLQEGLGVLPVPDTVVGPRPIYAHPLLKSLTTAFFQVYLGPEQPVTKLQQNLKQEFKQDLTQLDNNAFELTVIRSLRDIDLEAFK